MPNNALPRDQIPILKKINRYLTLKKRGLQLPLTGHCHGITLHWLDLMDNNQGQSYCDFAEKIVSANNQTLLNMGPDIELFLSRIEFLQNPEYYLKHTFQKDTGLLLERPSNLSIPFLFKKSSLESVLPYVISEKDMVTVMGAGHTIGIFRSGNQYHIFDSNYTSGKWKILTSTQQLTNEVIFRLFRRFGLTRQTVFPIYLSTSNNKKQNKKQLKLAILNFLLAQHDKPIDYLINNQTILSLAYYAGDTDTMKIVIERGANPNQWLINESLLTDSIKNNAHHVVTTLLNAGANPNHINFNGEHPLSVACKQGNPSTIHNLLKAGANPCHLNKNKITPLGVALEMQDWAMVAKFLSFINNPNDINSDNHQKICQHQSSIFSAVEKLEKTASVACRFNLDRIKKSIGKAPVSAYQKNNLFSSSVKFPDWMESEEFDDGITFGCSASSCGM